MPTQCHRTASVTVEHARENDGRSFGKAHSPRTTLARRSGRYEISTPRRRWSTALPTTPLPSGPDDSRRQLSPSRRGPPPRRPPRRRRRRATATPRPRWPNLRAPTPLAQRLSRVLRDFASYQSACSQPSSLQRPAARKAAASGGEEGGSHLDTYGSHLDERTWH